MDVHVTHDIALGASERAALAKAPGTLVQNPSQALVEAVALGEGIAFVDDQGQDGPVQYPLFVYFVFPEREVDEFRKAAPSVYCEGYFEPFQLAQCFESTDFFLQVPNGPTVQVKDERFTVDQIAEMFTFLDSSNLESSAGFEIRSHGVHSVLYNTRVDLYHLIGRTEADEYFSVKLRKTANSEAAVFEISDWKCK